MNQINELLGQVDNKDHLDFTAAICVAIGKEQRLALLAGGYTV